MPSFTSKFRTTTLPGSPGSYVSFIDTEGNRRSLLQALPPPLIALLR